MPACKKKIKVSQREIKINSYSVVMRAIEEGISYGLRRAFKYTHNPLTQEQMIHVEEQIDLAIGNSLGEVLSFGDEE